MTSCLDAALAYALYGWRVLPVEPGGKRPLPELTPHGVHDATTDHAQIRAWWARRPDAGVAIATGADSGLIVVDLDVRPDRGIDGRETWRELERQHGPVDTLQAITGGGGTHLVLRTSVRVRSSAGALGPGVDVRGDGGYIVAPPSLHASGRTYEWDGGECSPALVADAPAWLLAACAAQAAPVTTTATASAAVTLDQRQEDEIRSALAVLDPDGYDQWLRVGMALHSTGADAQAFRIWCEWARRSAKFDLPDHERRWRGFEPHGGVTVATIFGLARDAGWTQEPAATVVSVEDLPEPPAASARSEPPVPPGFLRTVAAYTVDTAVHPQPDLAVAAAIALAATVLGGRVCDVTDARTNLYILGVVRTGGGKERGRQVIKDVLASADQTALLGGEEVFSGQGLMAGLARSATSIFMIDELGMKLEAAAAEGPSGTTYLMIGTLMKLFSSACTVVTGVEYADQRARPRIMLEYPCCVLYATTTPGTLYAGLTAGAARSGFLPRLLVVEAMRTPRVPRPPKRPVPSDVTTWVRDVCQVSSTPSTSLEGRSRATPRMLIATPRAEAILEDYAMWADDKVRSRTRDDRRDDAAEDVWTRTAELANRLALVAACSAEPQTTTIDVTSAQWAVDYARARAQWLADAVRDHVGDTEYARTKIAFLTRLRSGGKLGVSHRDLGRLRPFCESRPRDRMAVLEDLLAAGLVDYVTLQTGGRTRSAWIALTGDAENDGADPQKKHFCTTRPAPQAT